MIVDAYFSLIVDGRTAPRRTRRGGAQALGSIAIWEVFDFTAPPRLSMPLTVPT